MVTRPRKVLSILLASTMIASMCILPTSVSAADADVENSEAAALASYYATNANGVGVKKSITVDGEISDWDSSMLIAQGAANDDPRVYRPDSMYEVGIDDYALYGAWDDSNLYLMWEMTNVQDVVAPNDDFPLTQGTLYMNMNVPFFIAIDTGKSDAIGNNGKTAAGETIWGSGITFENQFNRLIAVSTNGANGPYVYGGDSSGLNAVEIYTAKTSGITFKYGKGIVSQKINGINGAYGVNNGRVVGDVCSDSAAWVDFNTKGHSSASMDFHYEMSIPLETLGITANDIATNGVGVMQIATMGKSGMDCLPYDPTMNDNADKDDAAGSQEKNSFEKSDADHITVPFARIGNGDIPERPTSKPTTKPTSSPSNPTTATTATSAPSTGVTGTKSVTVAKGDTVTFTVKATSSTKKLTAYRMTTDYPSDAFSIDTSYSSDGVNTLGASSGQEVVNTGTAGKIQTAVLANSNYDISSAKALQTVKFKAKKAGTFKISYTMDEMLDTSSKDLATGGKVNSAVTMSVSASVTQAVVPETGSTTATFAKGDTVTVNVNLKSATKVYGFKTDLTYDSTMFTVKSVTFPNFSGGTTIANTDTAGKISTVGVGSPTKTFDFTTSKNLVRVTFTAKKAGTNSKIAYLMKEVIGLDAVNQFDETTGKSTVSTTTTSISAKTTTASTSLGSTSQSVKVSKGQVVTYTEKVKTSSKFNKYVTTVKYDTAAFGLYTAYSTDGVNTIKASQGGKEVVDTATAGTVKATLTAGANSPYTASTATSVIIVKFTAKKAGTFTISSTLDSMTNDSGTAMTSSQVTVTSSSSVVTPDTEKVAGVSKSIQVKQGEVIVYTVKAKTTVKFKTYKITTTYDSSAFDLYTNYSTDGVTTIKLNQGGTESVNTKTAGKVVLTATCASGTPYKATSATNLQIIKLKAKKAGTFTIGGTVNSMTNSSGTAMTSKDVTISNTGSVVIPFTESNSITVTKGQLVNYYVTVTLPNTGYDISGWTVDMYYDSDLFDVNKSFANSKGFAVGNAAINYATGASSTSATLPGGKIATANFNTAGTVTILDANSSGLSLKGKTTKLVCIQLKAKKAGTGVLAYSVKNFVGTNGTTKYINAKYQAVNGATFKMTAQKK